MITLIEEVHNRKKFTNTELELDSNMIKEIKNIIKGHKKASLPTMNYVMLEVVNDKVIRVKYTNGDLFIEKMFIAKIKGLKGDSFLVPINLFKEFKNIKKSDVFIFERVDNHLMKVTSEKMNKVITLGDETQFPSFNFLEKDEYNAVETSQGFEYLEYDDLKILEKASVSVSKSDTRPALKEISIENGYVVSTDGHRLYKSKTPLKANKNFLVNPILVKKALDIFEKNTFLKMSFSKFRVKIQDDYSTKIYYTIYSGNFPQTDRIIPVDFKYQFEMNHVKELVKFLKENKKESVTLIVNHKKNSMQVKVRSDEKSEKEIEIELPIVINIFENGKFEMTYNAEYLLESIMQLDESKFKMKIVGNLRPMILEKQNNPKELALLLPIKTV